MNTSNPFTDLRTILSDLYPTESDARRLIADAELNARNIAFSSHATNNWHAILVEARKSNRTDALIDVALREYPKNQRLRETYDAYLLWVEQVGPDFETAISNMVPDSVMQKTSAVMGAGGLIITIGLMILMVMLGERLIAQGMSKQFLYVLLLIAGMSAAISIFGFTRIFAPQRQGIWRTFEVVGMIMVAALVVLGGFLLVPSEDTFDVTLRVLLPNGLPLANRKIRVVYSNQTQTKELDSDGQVVLESVPLKYAGEPVTISILDPSGSAIPPLSAGELSPQRDYVIEVQLNEDLPTPTPTRRSKMLGEWNIAVADLVPIDDSSESQEVTQIIGEIIYRKLFDDAKQLKDIYELDILVQKLGRFGVTTGNTDEELELHIQQIAEEIDAQIFVYGTVERRDAFVTAILKIFIRTADAYEIDELGRYEFGKIEIAIPREDAVKVSVESSRALRNRSQILILLTRALASYATYHFTDALSLIKEASNDNLWQPSIEGRELLFQLQGNSALALERYNEAESAYRAALDHNPQYARAYLGLAYLYFSKAALVEANEGTDLCSFHPRFLYTALQHIDNARHVQNNESVDILSKVHFELGQIFGVLWYGLSDDCTHERHAEIMELFQLTSREDALEKAQEQFQAIVDEYEGTAQDSIKNQLEERTAEAYARLALFDQDNGKYEEAIEKFTKATTLTANPPRKALFEASLAGLYSHPEINRLDQAHEANEKSIDFYVAALELSYASNLKGRLSIRLAERYRWAKKWSEALSALQNADKWLPENSHWREKLEQERETIQNEKEQASP